MDWIDALAQCKAQNQACCLVTVLSTQGSIPRDSGSKMVVTEKQQYDSIGGGALEYQASTLAREALKSSEPRSFEERFNLSKDLKQCCGGQVTLLFEVIIQTQPTLHLFGAGHIAKAMLPMLSELGWQVNWYDARAECFPEEIPATINAIALHEPELAVESAAVGGYFVVMTHDHALDQSLVELILARGDASYCGLIGSQSKRAKFLRRLRKKQFCDAELARLTCPIGIKGINGKRPIEIAISVVAELLVEHNEQAHQALPAQHLKLTKR